MGCEVLAVADGPSALRALRAAPHVDLLVTDVGLPGGMNGRQLADAAREVRPGLKVLFMTGYAENAAFGNGVLEPGMWIMTKPFALDALAARVRAMIADA
jgi:CheY-like chemotaxis protein